MSKVKKIIEGSSINPDPNNPQIINGEIQNPVPYEYVDIIFEDDKRVQIEKIIGETKTNMINRIKAQYQAKHPRKTFNGLSEGDNIVL